MPPGGLQLMCVCSMCLLSGLPWATEYSYSWMPSGILQLMHVQQEHYWLQVIYLLLLLALTLWMYVGGVRASSKDYSMHSVCVLLMQHQHSVTLCAAGTLRLCLTRCYSITLYSLSIHLSLRRNGCGGGLWIGVRGLHKSVTLLPCLS